MSIVVKRIYDPPAESDGTRVLVDRLWPRGVSKGDAQIDNWMKDIAPSDALRRWFNHDPKRWPEFVTRYHKELHRHGDLVAELRAVASRGRLTLIYSAKDTDHNNATALKGYLLRRGAS